MKNTLLLSVLLLAFLAATFASCKKADSGKSSQELIVGTWTLTKESADTNKNNQLDSIFAISFTVAEKREVTFNADGSGHWDDYYNSDSTARKTDFSWSFNDGYKNLRIIGQYTLAGPNWTPIPVLDTSNAVVTTLTQTNLNFYVEEKSGDIFLKEYSRN